MFILVPEFCLLWFLVVDLFSLWRKRWTICICTTTIAWAIKKYENPWFHKFPEQLYLFKLGMLLQLQVRGNPIYGKGIVLAIKILKEKNVSVLQNHRLSVISALFLAASLFCMLAFILMHEASQLQYGCHCLKFKAKLKTIGLFSSLYFFFQEKKLFL